MRVLHLLIILLLIAGFPRAAVADDEVVRVFDDLVIHWIKDLPDIREPDGYAVRHTGQTVERTLSLPPAPPTPGQARRIVATVTVRPILSNDASGRPRDPWTRVGNVSVLAPGADGAAVETEIMRFVTPYGGPDRFEQDVTAFAPFLHGTATLRAYISSYSPEPGWTISLALRYTDEGLGQRRPAFVRQLFNAPHVTAAAPRLTAKVEIPAGLDRPRLRIVSTGHATDGLAGNEFVSCTNVVRIDGREVARFRPWAEEGGTLRGDNPWAGRRLIEGRELRASDFDRSGWHPATAVEPLLIPVPELTPGTHEVEIEVLGIRPKDPAGPDGKEHHGYWFVVAAVVADEPWPER